MTTTPTAVRLTKREIEVLGLVAQGHGSQEVADLLYVSKRTVDFHLENIYSKLGVHCRTKALRVAMLKGIIVMPASYYETNCDPHEGDISCLESI